MHQVFASKLCKRGWLESHRLSVWKRQAFKITDKIITSFKLNKNNHLLLPTIQMLVQKVWYMTFAKSTCPLHQRKTTKVPGLTDLQSKFSTKTLSACLVLWCLPLSNNFRRKSWPRTIFVLALCFVPCFSFHHKFWLSIIYIFLNCILLEKCNCRTHFFLRLFRRVSLN